MVSGSALPSERWFDLAWVEWVGVVGSILTLLGLWLTWKQARDAKTAANAAATASRDAQNQLRAKQVLMQVGELRWTVSSLEGAIERNEGDAVRILLNSWRYSAGQLHGVLQDDGSVSPELLTKMQASLGLAFAAGSALADKRRTVRSSCAEVRRSISEAFDELNQWAGQASYLLATDTGGS